MHDGRLDAMGDLMMGPQHDGLICTSYREGIVVSGGANMRHLWRFSFRTLEWSVLRSQGQYVPSGRVYHTANMWGDSLIVTGGVTADAEDVLHVNRLDMTSMRWSRVVVAFPEEDMLRAPLARSHHASTIIGDFLYIHGGKPVQAGLTTSDFRRLHHQGFYDVLILHLPTGSWSRRAHSLVDEYVPAPPLWGHSMVGLEGAALVLFGGFEIDMAIGTGEASYPTREDYDRHLLLDAPTDAPAAELQNIMNVFSLRTMRWSAFAPNIMAVGPRPRALHTVQLLRDRELIVMGGVALMEESGAIMPASDAWVWSADTGSWRRLDPFPIPPFSTAEPHRFQGARILSTIYNDQLVVTNDVSTWYVLDTTDPVEFTVVGAEESEYFYCACVSMDDWQIVTNEVPQPFDNPLVQHSLFELSAVVHPRRGLPGPQISLSPVRAVVPASHSTVAPSRSVLPMISNADREDALRKFLPFANGQRPSADRQGQINPIIAALISERA